MNRLTRQRKLTAREAAKYRSIRKKIEKEFPSREAQELLLIKFITALEVLENFVGMTQLAAMKEFSLSEEGDFFVKKAIELSDLIQGMPKSYEQDGKGDAAIVSLHYFNSSMDWFITEKDAGRDDDEVKGVQSQAFGLADLYHDGGELGYICIAELIKNGAELDFHFAPKSLGEVKASRK